MPVDRSELISRIGHELRTPLNSIIGFAQVLQADGLAAEQQESVAHILRGGRRLHTLINGVLDVARLENGSLPLSPEAVAVSDVVRNAVDTIRPLAEERQISVQVESLPASCVLADRARLSQILLTLLSNAVTYNRRGGTVRVFSVTIDPSRVVLVVADTGAGIPSDQIARLFTPFERLGVDPSAVEGTGLGLALARGLAEAMNGALTVESVVDEGSAFRLELPATELTAGASDLEFEPRRPRDAGTCGTVLYIEDNRSNVKLMERILRRRPAVELLHAGDGRTGVALVQQRRPDLVLLDLHLPDGPGGEVLRQICDDPALRHIPVVILSAGATPEQIRTLLASGASSYLTKPFDIEGVLYVVDQALGPVSQTPR